MKAYMVWRPVEFKVTSRFDLDDNPLPCGRPTQTVEILGVFTDKGAAKDVAAGHDGASVMYLKIDEPESIFLDATIPEGA